MQARERGVTLVEVSLSLGLMAAGLLGAAGLQLRALQASEQARQHSQAVWLAQSVLEVGRAAQTLTTQHELAWQMQLKAALGAHAHGWVRQVGGGHQVQVQWPGASGGDPMSIDVPGRLAP
ncbi:hypothetical protein SJI00_10875 [Pseudomonas sp. RP23018S]|uniref:hypothetical protein n=1 Tax=Pseudomonas sp. RP23018S TaxID=3096037 RepID=UPI002ACA75A4|nr:hypothetical protein [Pseudomonas sp. RP23018S]MDZ5603277.1 hypothetical protein [Pseudomonas sp. RP23018S]